MGGGGPRRVRERQQGHAREHGSRARRSPTGKLATATLTLDARPTDNLIIRLENRGDFIVDGSPSKNIFREHERDTSSKLITTTLGVVVTTN